MIKMTRARGAHKLSRSWILEQRLKDHNPTSQAKLELDVALAMCSTLTEEERLIVERTAMSRQQHHAIPALAKEMNNTVEWVTNLRNTALNKLRKFFMQSKFTSVTCRIYRLPELGI